MRRLPSIWIGLFSLALVTTHIATAQTPTPAGEAPGQPNPPTTAPSPEMAAADKFFEATDWPNAIKAYDAITRSDPKNARAWFMLGLSRHSNADHAAAIPAYRRAAENAQLRPVCLYNIACALALSGDKDQAFAELDNAIENGFRNLTQLDEDADLASLRSDARFAAARRRAAPTQDLVKELDFWVGEWDVFNPQGQQVGTSTIEKVERGALILEHWSNMTGGTGRSINFIDPATRRWNQIWVDPSGTVVRYEGGRRDNAMILEGTNQPPHGKPKLTRMALTPTPDGKVRQWIEHSTDNGITWTTYFDGLYTRKPAASPSGS